MDNEFLSQDIVQQMYKVRLMILTAESFCRLTALKYNVFPNTSRLKEIDGYIGDLLDLRSSHKALFPLLNNNGGTIKLGTHSDVWTFIIQYSHL